MKLNSNKYFVQFILFIYIAVVIGNSVIAVNCDAGILKKFDFNDNLEIDYGDLNVLNMITNDGADYSDFDIDGDKSFGDSDKKLFEGCIGLKVEQNILQCDCPDIDTDGVWDMHSLLIALSIRVGEYVPEKSVESTFKIIDPYDLICIAEGIGNCNSEFRILEKCKKEAEIAKTNNKEPNAAILTFGVRSGSGKVTAEYKQEGGYDTTLSTDRCVSFPIPKDTEIKLTAEGILGPDTRPNEFVKWNDESKKSIYAFKLKEDIMLLADFVIANEKKPEKSFDLSLTIATQKNTYLVGEEVKLTEPDKKKQNSDAITGRAVSISRSSSTTTTTIPPASPATSNIPATKKRLYGINDIEELTSEILGESKVYQTASAREKESILSSIEYKSAIRKEIMIILIRENPRRFLRNAISRKSADILPDKIKDNIEKEIEIKNGNWEVLHTDDFENPSNSRFDYSISKETGGLFGLDLNFWIFDKRLERFSFYPDGEVPDALSGSKVNIQGYRIEDSIAAEIGQAGIENGATNFEIAQVAQPETLGPQRVAIILIKAQGTGDSDLPTKEVVAKRVFNGIIQDFYKEASYGKMSLQGSVADVYGWYDVEAEFAYPYNVWITDILPIVDKDIDFRKYDRVMIGVARNYGGHASVGKYLLWADDGIIHLSIGTFGSITKDNFLSNKIARSDFTFSHEFGHELGVLHANAWECDTEIFEGYCHHIEYGNLFDVMGAGFGEYGLHYNGYFKEVFKWLTTEEKQVLDIKDSGSYYLKPLEKDGAIVAKVHNDNPNSAVFYLEYRQPIGFDRNLENPASKNDIGGIHINWKNAELATRLLDMKSEDYYYFLSSALMPGKTFEERTSGIKISNEGEDKAGEELKFSVEINKNIECSRKFYLFPLKYSTSSTRYQPLPISDSIEMQRGLTFNLYIDILNFDAITCSESNLEFELTSPNWINYYEQKKGVISLNRISNGQIYYLEITIPEDENLGEHEISFKLKNLISGQQEERKVKIIVTDPYASENPIIEKDFGIVQFISSNKNFGLGKNDFKFANNNGVKHEGIYTENFYAKIQSYNNQITEDDFNSVVLNTFDYSYQMNFIGNEGVYCTQDTYEQYICTWYSKNNLVTLFITDGFQGLKKTYGNFYVEAYNAMKSAYLKKYPSSIEKKSVSKCEDSDRGKEYYKRGKATTTIGENQITFEDFCSMVINGKREVVKECKGDDCRLHEFYCSKDSGNEVSVVELYLCENGCDNGACIKKPASQIIKKDTGVLKGRLIFEVHRMEEGRIVESSQIYDGYVKSQSSPDAIIDLAGIWAAAGYFTPSVEGYYEVSAKLTDITIGKINNDKNLESKWEFVVKR